MDEKWHAVDYRVVIDRLETSIDNGLSSAEARRRLEKYGLNTIEAGRGKRLYEMVIEQVKNLFMLLLIAAIIIAVVVGEYGDALSIAIILCIMVAAGVVQEYRAEKALEKLRSLVVPKARVLRDGRLVEIDTRYIVPGDIIVLQEGDLVPADARLIESNNLYVDESMLTGESTPVPKNADKVLDPDTPVADHVNMVYSGTYIVRGSGKAVVVATGMDTQLGRIARMVVETHEEKTHLHRELDRLARQLGIVIIGIAVIVLVLAITLGITDPVDALLTSIALAVAAVPEGLPAVLTMILALSVLRMARRKALVRKLGAVEALGRVTVIATDKTGTITRNEMTVKKLWLPGIGYLDVTGSGYLREGSIVFNGDKYVYGHVKAIDLLVEDAVLCNNASIDYSVNPPKPIGDPLEAALIVLGYKAGLDPNMAKTRYKRLREIPFSSERKMMSVIVRSDNGLILYSKGAPEVILSKSTHVLEDGVVKELSSEKKREIMARAEEMASKGLRVLAYAYRVVDEREVEREDVENKLVFIGLTGLIDPPRPEVPGAIKKAIGAGINVVMVTGDHAITAKAIAEMIGLPIEGKKIVTGYELEKMSDEELASIIDDVAIFARVTPEHKLRIVKAFKKRGHVIAMTGDGVNDAPALKLADVGVAMGLRGTDVAREAADLVLEDDNFATIVAAIEEGRTSYSNIRKATLYLLSANMAEVLLVLSSILFLEEIILTPAMILWINLVTDSIPAITLGLEPPEPGIMRIKPWEFKPLLGKTGLVYLGYIGVVLALLSWFTGHLLGSEYTAVMTATYLGLSIAELAHSFNMRSPDKSILSIGVFKNKYHVLGYIAGVTASIIPLYTVPWLLEATSLPINKLLIVYIIAHTIVVVEEVRKRITTAIP